jgi:uncharacterized membrane protein SpoIIM required for sporulation
MGVGVAFVLLGIFILAAIGFRWDWFVNHYKVRRITRRLGKTGTTVFYIIWGLAFVIVGVLIMTGTLTPD